MRFNRRGDLTGGVGTVPLWVWLREAAAPQGIGSIGGGCDWLGTDTIIGQVEDPHARLVTWTRESGWALTGTAPNDHGGANTLRATGIGDYGATYATPHNTYGYEHGQPFSGRADFILDADDALVFSSDPRLPADYLPASVRVHGRCFVYCTGNPPQVHLVIDGLPVSMPVLGAGQWAPLAFACNGAFYLWYFTDEYGTVLHRVEDSSHGVVTPNAWSKDVWIDEAGRCWLAFATGEAEAIDQARVVALDALPWQAFAPIVPPVEPPIHPVDPPVHPIDPPVHPVDPPVHPPEELPDMRVSMCSTPELGFVVEEVPHYDAGRVGLKRADGKFLTVDRVSGAIRWSDQMQGWEGFYPSQTSYAAVMDDGTARIFPKGPVFA